MKAILVIDMPSCCNSCRYCEYIQSDEYTRCILECREVKNDMKKPNWCPLIDINDNIARLVEVAR